MLGAFRDRQVDAAQAGGEKRRRIALRGERDVVNGDGIVGSRNDLSYGSLFGFAIVLMEMAYDLIAAA